MLTADDLMGLASYIRHLESIASAAGEYCETLRVEDLATIKRETDWLARYKGEQEAVNG